MGSCAAPSAKGDDKFITTDYLQQCHIYLCLCFTLEATHLCGFLWIKLPARPNWRGDLMRGSRTGRPQQFSTYRSYRSVT
ncbi:hypothetical protein AR916_22760 [Salmonella enterica subsp. enterica serovar Typhimurium var. 5-]|nr:hypothetical protein [Salmonella enterica subsp. enterica serovar Typhimurium var. 5-]EBV8618652.1 hypothetical protein [Salmonella enterica subsp. enterica serovar Typhimurium var. 5-]